MGFELDYPWVNDMTAAVVSTTGDNPLRVQMSIRIGQLGDSQTLVIITHENGTATPARRTRSGNGQSIHYRLYDAPVCPAGGFALIATKAGNLAWVVRSKG
ncbi:Decarboxylase yanB [Fusarium oxysporum f. sp. albedinis]|nr:Decarboxylase yanB [Fusarium oxysporum f. sp. albedinis]